MSDHDRERRLDDETLVQWLLDPALRAELPREELSAADREALAEWEGVVRFAREEFADERVVPAADADRVADAVLARTSREHEDLGWRGDLRLVRGFVGRRLRASWLLRVAAASLLLHLAALPVLAIYGVLRTTEEPPRILVEPPRDDEPLFAEPGREEVPDLESPSLPALDGIGTESLAVQNAVNADAWSVFRRREELRAVARGDWTTPTERRLAARAARLIGEPVENEAPGADTPLDRILDLDAALDARLAGSPLLLDEADVEWLAREAAAGTGEAELAKLVLLRAARYGATLPEHARALVDATPEDARELETGRSAPLAADWARALSAAAPPGAVSPAFVDALAE